MRVVGKHVWICHDSRLTVACCHGHCRSATPDLTSLQPGLSCHTPFVKALCATARPRLRLCNISVSMNLPRKAYRSQPDTIWDSISSLSDALADLSVYFRDTSDNGTQRQSTSPISLPPQYGLSQMSTSTDGAGYDENNIVGMPPPGLNLEALDRYMTWMSTHGNRAAGKSCFPYHLLITVISV